jgi:hypothetical protein
MFKCEARDEEKARALIRCGEITHCPLCAVAFIASVAHGAATRLIEQAERVEGTDFPTAEMLASAIIKQAFDRVSRGRWSHENLLVFATDEVNATAHLILHPDTFVGALIEIDTTALNKPVSPTPTAPRPQGKQ